MDSDNRKDKEKTTNRKLYIRTASDWRRIDGIANGSGKCLAGDAACQAAYLLGTYESDQAIVFDSRYNSMWLANIVSGSAKAG